jgi:hypothetical protein
MRIARCLLAIMATTAGIQLATAGVAAASPFVVCSNQTYALCAEASCFLYDNVAYCKCDILNGDSISLQLSYSSPGGTQDACDVNAQGQANGYMLSTFSLPANSVKGGSAAVYTCPGPANKGAGVPAPVAYGQCDGGFCFKSTSGQSFPGFNAPLQADEIICSCPISTAATPGSTNPLGLGYQIFGSYNPTAPAGSRCDPNGCAACSVAVANGNTIPVGAPTGGGRLLTVLLDGRPNPKFNQCLCTCTTDSNGKTSCSVGADTTP